MRTDRIAIGSAIVMVIAAYTAAVFAFFSTAGESRLFLLGIIGLPLSVVLFLFPRAALMLLGLLVYSVDWLSDVWHAVPREATWLIDILILLLLGRTALFSFRRKEPIPSLEKWIYVLIGFAVLSTIINGSGRATAFVGMRVGFRYLGLFVAAYYLSPSPRWLRGYVRFLFVIGLIQVPVVLIQYFVYGWSDPDLLCGTFGISQTPAVALFLLILITYLVSRMIEERHLRLGFVVAIGIMMICPLLGEAKFFFMFLPLLMIFMIRREFLGRPVMAIGITLAAVAAIVAADFVIVASGGWVEGRNPLTYVRKLPEVFAAELEPSTEERYERSYTYVAALRLAAESPKHAVFGNGPGSITQSVISEGHSAKSAYFSQWGLSSNATSIPWLLIEYGYVGTGIMLFILYSIYRRGRVLRHSGETERRTYGRTLESITFLYGGWLFYAPSWQSDTMNFVYWPLAAFLVHLSYQPGPAVAPGPEGAALTGARDWRQLNA
ncbi:hypothetical protein HZB60_11925 [candidate division KSB1 bacterium]|nr:hypothetical protein [candidate division KSB1 bacterium]